MSRPHPETISPTAHYTGYVWIANQLSHPAFTTVPGRALHAALYAPNRIARAIGAPSLDGMLVARHRLIDLRLADAIDRGEVTQVIEVAAGLSPRGWRFHERYGDRITYLECDLPGMLANKRAVLARLGCEDTHHRTHEIDALVDTGPTSLAAIADTLDPTRGTAIITEGLINYFDLATVRGIWRRFSTVLSRFPTGRYFSDLVFAGANAGPFVTAFSTALSVFVRGKVHLHFADEPAAREALRAEGFASAQILDPADFAGELPGLELAGARRVRIIDAATRDR